MKKVFVSVDVNNRLPNKNGYYTIINTLGVSECYLFHNGNWFENHLDMDDNKDIFVSYWLKETELPSNEEICKEGFDNSMCSISFAKGANYILNKLK